VDGPLLGRRRPHAARHHPNHEEAVRVLGTARGTDEQVIGVMKNVYFVACRIKAE
jgi:hypothetical protein